MREHNALGLAGRAGRELDEGRVPRGYLLQAARARDVIEVVHEKGARGECGEELRLPRRGGEGAETLERALLGVQIGRAQAARDTQHLVAVFVADAERHRHRHDAAEDRRPEDVDELLVVVQEQDQLVAAARTQALQVIEDPDGALVELGEGDLARFVLTLQVGDAAVDAAVDIHELDQGVDVWGHRRSSRIYKGWRVRRLICASSSSGLSGT